MATFREIAAAAHLHVAYDILFASVPICFFFFFFFFFVLVSLAMMNIAVKICFS